MSLLEEALVYLDMGWCVYPSHCVDLETGLCSCGRPECPTPGKHPIGRWTDFQNRLPTPNEVEAWFTLMDCNVGMVTGKISGVVVVDADGDEGINSVRSLGLERTLSSRTGGGGMHLFYSTNTPVQNKVRVANGIDIRGDGGYVVLPPSLHRSGKVYHWLEPRPLEPFDAELFDKLSPSNGNGSNGGPGWASDLLQGVTEGSRNVSAARLAGRYATLGLTLEEAWILMAAWNERNMPPLDEVELNRTVNAVYRKHLEAQPVKIQTLGQIRRLLEGEQYDR